MAKVLKYSEAVKWDIKEIDAKVGELRKNLFELRMTKASQGVAKGHEFSVLKKNIARLLTARNALNRKVL